MNRALRPEDIIADGVDFTVRNNIKVRKGSVAAIAANIKVLEGMDSLPEEKMLALEILKELSITWFALDLDQIFMFKNLEVQKLFDNLKNQVTV